MTNKEACGPCAKRKVRCDKQDPCSNCKRRKTDRCVYPSVSPADRIRKLEALVRRLGGDPNDHAAYSAGLRSQTVSSNGSTPVITQQNGPSESERIEIRSQDPVVLEEDGQSFYLETRAWQGWLGHSDSNGGLRINTRSRNPFLVRKRPHALSSMLPRRNHVDLSAAHPSSEHATTLWDTFERRVEPVVRISFRWVLKALRAKCFHAETRSSLSDAEHALVFGIYYITIVSLRDDECRNALQQIKSTLLTHYQAICEEAILSTNLLCVSEITVIKAVIFYIMASYDRLSIQSLWSLMGLTVRNAEKLGMHRDGTILGLSPAETEDRRRVWWQLQHVDLCLGVWAGLTPITLMADWDAKIPLNIEDDDIKYDTDETPKERKGLTSMSYCRWAYWVLDQQRQIFLAKQSRFAIFWQSNSSIASTTKDSVVSQLEDGLNQHFLQYCDPLKPIDTLIQLLARYLIAGMQMRVLHASALGGDKENTDEKSRAELSEASMQNLRYFIAIQSHHLLQEYRWFTKGMFSWHALMFVLVEASREDDLIKARETWDLLANVYAANNDLFELSDDRRRHHAAELVVAAWKSREYKFGPSQHHAPPNFVTLLGNELATQRMKAGQEDQPERTSQSAYSDDVPMTAESLMTSENVDDTFDLDFQDIDWSFWNSME